jgi:hypothetical protein
MALVKFPPPVKSRPAPVAAPPPGSRARQAGVLTLAIGFVTALSVYAVGIYQRGPEIEDLIPNYTAANSRQMGLLYGHSGELMWETMQALKQPTIQAIVIAVVSVLVAIVCFRIAWLDADHAAGERDAHR